MAGPDYRLSLVCVLKTVIMTISLKEARKMNPQKESREFVLKRLLIPTITQLLLMQLRVDRGSRR